jgi:hypothetical protein
MSGTGRTHPSIELVACPQCKATVGSPCVSKTGKTTDAHHVRCQLADLEVKKQNLLAKYNK